MRFAPGVVLYVLLWGGWTGMGMQGFEDRELSIACDAAASKENGAVLLRVSYTRSPATYAVSCNTPRCAEPPASVTVERVTCKRAPEHYDATLVPEHWEAR